MNTTVVRFLSIGMVLCGSMMQQPAYALSEYDRWVMVTNKTEYAVIGLYGSRVSVGTWESNIIPNKFIGAMRQLAVNFGDGSGSCLIDLRAVMSNGQELIHRGFDACTLNEWTLFQK
jgi:hypothetical protein